MLELKKAVKDDALDTKAIGVKGVERGTVFVGRKVRVDVLEMEVGLSM